MCGIVLLAGDLSVVHEKALRTLLVLDSIRGEDSTGIAAISRFQGAEVKIAKQVGDPFQLFDDKKYDAALRLPNRVLIGHNRWATVGGVSRATAHPFENDQLVGVHNGTLKNKWVLDKASNYKVDSENLFYHMSKNGLEQSLKIIDGAWALVWWDKEDETINILRNKERPLWWCSSVNAKGEPDMKAFFAASEPWMLRVALSRHGIPHSDIEEVEVDKHFKIPVGVLGVLGKPIIKEAPGTYQTPGYNGFFPKQETTPTGANVISLNKVRGQDGKEAKTTVEPKKPDLPVSVPDTNSGSCFDRNYLRAKNVVFELMDGCADKDGVEFLSLFDRRRPYFEIRLYPETMSDTIWEMVGSDISADISMWVPGTVPGRGYYKVRAMSVRVLATIEDVKPEHTEKSANGRDMNIVEWQRAYPTCSWCSSPLEFGQARFSTASEAFCHDCAKHPEVLDAVKF